MRLFLNLLLSEDGVATVEYIVMLTMIVLVMLISLSAVGYTSVSMWTTVTDGVDGSW